MNYGKIQDRVTETLPRYNKTQKRYVIIEVQHTGRGVLFTLSVHLFPKVAAFSPYASLLFTHAARLSINGLIFFAPTLLYRTNIH